MDTRDKSPETRGADTSPSQGAQGAPPKHLSKKKLRKPKRVEARVVKGFRDVAASELRAREAMITIVREVYERYGFERLETPAFEYVDVLGKFLPESDEVDGGIFALQLQEEAQAWIATRYDMTAPLARYFASHRQDLPKPFRRYQVGPVWRMEKPGPGRFREFTQFDFDTVGSSAMAADAEACALLADSLEALGIARGDYLVRLNNRKVLNGVLERIGVERAGGQELIVLRAIDKFDRLGSEGVTALLGPGRRDESGDFTKGAGLEPGAIRTLLEVMSAGEGCAEDPTRVLDRLRALVGEQPIGLEGLAELQQIHSLLEADGIGPDRVRLDPGVVRGLAYYTGPVFEAELLLDLVDDDGLARSVGSVAGGGRYDGLIQRFTGEAVAATGASIGVDRLLTALSTIGRLPPGRRGPVLVCVLDREALPEYQRIVRELRQGGVAAELYMGNKGFKAQLKYADRRDAPVAVIAGGDEFERGEVSLKDLALGAELSEDITDRDEWRKGQPAQVSVPRARLLEETRAIIARREL